MLKTIGLIVIKILLGSFMLLGGYLLYLFILSGNTFKEVKIVLVMIASVISLYILWHIAMFGFRGG